MPPYDQNIEQQVVLQDTVPEQTQQRAQVRSCQSRFCGRHDSYKECQ